MVSGKDTPMIRQYNIPFEEEVMPLFIGGVSVVGLIALVIGCLLLYRKRRALCLFFGHMASLAAAMFQFGLEQWLLSLWEQPSRVRSFLSRQVRQ